MRAFFKRFGEPIEHPEFMGPGFLLLMIGIALGILSLFIGFSHISWPYAGFSGLLIACGVGLLLKHIVGSVLFVGVLAYWLYRGIRNFPSEWSDVIGFALGVLVLFSFVACAIEQFKYHRERRKGVTDFILPPPSQTL
jgi:hypothetical protein